MKKKKRLLTKKQLKLLAQAIIGGIDPVKVRAHYANLCRQELLANKVFSKKKISEMPDEVAIELSMQHMRAFLGMDRPNVFTGTK